MKIQVMHPTDSATLHIDISGDETLENLLEQVEKQFLESTSANRDKEFKKMWRLRKRGTNEILYDITVPCSFLSEEDVYSIVWCC